MFISDFCVLSYGAILNNQNELGKTLLMTVSIMRLIVMQFKYMPVKVMLRQTCLCVPGICKMSLQNFRGDKTHHND